MTAALATAVRAIWGIPPARAARVSVLPAPSSRPTTVDSLMRRIAKVPEVAPVPDVGAVLAGQYELRERIGVGGMARVFRAHDRGLGREVAVKVPRTDKLDLETAFAMFEREARATARLHHPNIVAVHHIGHHAGLPFAVLELLQGEPLAARLAREPMSTPRALGLLDSLLHALGHAHARGIVHRDLTPRNVFVTSDRAIKLLDFGVAIDLAASAGTLTRGAGTPGYMAPEHREAPDPRSDLWALAVLFFECVTGRRPPEDPNAMLALLPADLSAKARSGLARALHPSAEARPKSADAMRAAMFPPASPALPRRRALLGLALAGAVGLAAGHALRKIPLPGRRRVIIPRDGRWRGDPPGGMGWETRLQRIDAEHFHYENHDRISGRGGGGTLTLELLADGSTILSGRTADDPTCPTCVNVGFIEFIVLAEDQLYQQRAGWGPSHDHYVEWFPPYRYVWHGPLSTAADR
ncbi:serine/threonine protein kinase [Pendulispora rubella]|uniref:Serine/threonine protein kinase n=1 Tax=Pendulispora rubella TaxID=2741070 RepID=A0ABZ2LCA3_9BACT